MRNHTDRGKYILFNFSESNFNNELTKTEHKFSFKKLKLKSLEWEVVTNNNDETSIDNWLFNAVATNEKIDDIIQSINFSIDFLMTSYALLQLEVLAMQDKDIEEKNLNLYPFFYNYENVLYRVFSLNDLLFHLMNEYFSLEVVPGVGFNRNVLEKIQNSTITNILKKDNFKTKDFRNDFTHNIKPFQMVDKYEIKTINNNDIIFGKEGFIKLTPREGLSLLDKDIDFLKNKYKYLINETSLKFEKDTQK